MPPHAKPCGVYGAQGRLWAQAHAGDQAEQAASGSRSSTGGTPQQRAQAAFPNVTAVGELDVSGYASVLDTVVALVWCVASQEALRCSYGHTAMPACSASTCAPVERCKQVAGCSHSLP